MKYLQEKGYKRIRILSRNTNRIQHPVYNKISPSQIFYWDPAKGIIDTRSLDGVKVVIHLAGESVAKGRWTKDKKKRMLDSRVDSIRLLMDLMEKVSKKSTSPSKFIFASAIGIYGNRANEDLDEDGKSGTDYLASVCKSVEESVFNRSLPNTKIYCLRIGIVLGKNGGALKAMLTPFKLGLGGRIGKGEQFMSWIHLEDLLHQIDLLMNCNLRHSIYNGVSPHPCSNAFFTKTLSDVLGKPALMPIPSLGLKLALGEKSQIVLDSQKVYPKNFLRANFNYKYPHLKQALQDILK